MALDGVFLRHIKKELEQRLIGSKVDKIYQPARDQLIFAMRSREGTDKLLLSARANSPRINITSSTAENPKVPPMLCMLLRKRFSGARLRSVIQSELERILILEFEAVNEFGDIVTLKISMEIMGQYSNIVFIDENGLITDAIKRVDASMSSKRLVLPGIPYEMPPAQMKMSMLEYDAEDIIKAVETLSPMQPLSKGLLGILQGVSPIICRELEYLTGRGRDVFCGPLNEEERTRLSYFLKRDIKTVRECSGVPCIITDQSKKPVDFTFEHIQQYGSGRSRQETETFCELLDEYYSKRDLIELMKNRSEDLTKLMSNAAARLIKKIYIQQDELKSCTDREHFRICGDLLQANLYRVKKGDEYCDAENYYEEASPVMRIKLDPALSPSENAQRYYRSYRKAKTAEQVLKVQIEKAEQELDYVSSVLDSLSRAESMRELNEIREELTEQGYIRASGKKRASEKPLDPREFVSESGFRILVGRNNRQNDILTLKTANKNDIWLHVRNIPGSHTIIICDKKEPDDQTLLYAASIAAFHSKAKEAGKVEVDYTRVKYVSKPQGARPGRVIYTDQKTLFVKPTCDEQEIKKST